ncbi:MAG TPA: DUF4383 domain-containing protein [Acidimicrobiales bacterium]|nr:DUF4383 domain-containing protein [Acidimicrobiales bacterium]
MTRTLTLVLAVAFLAAGVAGFAVTGFDDVVGHSHQTLLGLEVNPLHNLVHILIGAVGLVAWRGRMRIRDYGVMLAVGYGLVFLYGLMATHEDSILSINQADNWFHLTMAAAGAFLAWRTWGPARLRN